jgi:hypothetical protein
MVQVCGLVIIHNKCIFSKNCLRDNLDNCFKTLFIVRS